uniref:Uncharacterized protein n=1 Tax=Anopheles albimanus TaxID=7167 RepID=A0A182FXG9_ANOAL
MCVLFVVYIFPILLLQRRVCEPIEQQ